MWMHVMVWLAAFYTTTFGYIEQFDVTTIYYVENIIDSSTSGIKREVHSRTNALGLKVSDHFTTFDYKSAREYNITCDVRSSCDWTLENGNTFSRRGQTILDSGVYAVKGVFGISLNKTKPIDPYLIILFTPTKTLIRTSSAYYRLKLFDQSIDLIKCTAKDGGYYTHKDRDGTKFLADGYDIATVEKLNYSLLWISFKDSRIKIWNGNQQQSNLLLDWEDDEYEGLPSVKVKYFSIDDGYSSMEDHSGSLIHNFVVLPVNTSIFSPSFTPLTRALCLAVVYDSQGSYEDELLVHVENSGKSSHRLLNFRLTKSGLSYKVVNGTVPDEFGDNIRIRVWNKASVDVFIHRIATCNTEGEDVEVLGPLLGEELEGTDDFPVFDVDRGSVDKNEDETQAKCLKEGEPTSVGCACPAGFVGPDCTQGCGRNRFGLDCGGVCSLHSSECRGLRLCTPRAGCHCAPGYSGYDCTIHCGKGRYGVDCQDTCGRCASNSTCDIYTGECSLCEAGYYPPNCKQAYVYYSSEPNVSSPEYGKIILTFNPKNIAGHGSPKLYQVQYKEMEGQWINYKTKVVPSNSTSASESIEGLSIGTRYELRVLFMDRNFNKYSGDLIKTSQIVTKCYIPNTYNYRITTSTYNASTISIYWTYTNGNDSWCPVKQYEVNWTENWKPLSVITENNNFTLTDLLPGTTVKIRVRALTSAGYAPDSDVVVASLPYKAKMSSVRNLRIVTAGSSTAQVAWEPPRDSGSHTLMYRITYKCVEQPACGPGCHNASDAEMATDTTTVSLGPLLPFTQYLVTVAVEDGPGTSIYVGTTETVPEEVPVPSAKRPVRANTSLTVAWDPVPVCSSLLLGYNYRLIKDPEGLNVLESGFTEDTSISFHNVTANADYLVRVYVVTAAGWNPGAYLTIPITAAGETAHNLTVYKRGRTMLGVRWAMKTMNGQQAEYTVMLRGQNVKSTSYTIEPSHCVIWTHLYCHTLQHLRPNRKYDVTIRASDKVTGEVWGEASVSAITKEGAATAPEDLKLVNVSSNSAVMQWHHPLLANGIIRTFVISIEEITQFDQDNCCQDYPLIEIPVKEEKETYETEVTGLQPASVYSLSVTAKTVVMGPSQSLEVTTSPPHLPVDLPTVIIPTENEWSWPKPEENSISLFANLIKTRLLLATSDTPDEGLPTSSGITDVKLNTLLYQLIERPFYLISEYIPGEEINVTLVPEISAPFWSPGHGYQLIAAQITEYGGVYNVDLAYTTTIIYDWMQYNENVLSYKFTGDSD